MKGLFVLLLCLGFSGCATMQNPNFATTSDEAITYKTDKGKAMVEKYRPDLDNIYKSINEKFQGQVVFWKNQTGFTYDEQLPNNKYLQVSIAINIFYNTIGSDFNKRAATAFSRYGKDLLGIILSDDKLFNSGEFQGVKLNMSWGAKNFVQDQYFGGEWEGVSIMADTQSCRDFLNFKITNQDFINKSKVVGAQGNSVIGKINIDLKDTM